MPLFPSPALLAPAWRVLRLALRVVGSVVLAAWVIFLAAWLALHWAILPRIDAWRPSLERAATQALGQPVEIGAIRVESSGWVPTLELADVVVRDGSGQEALRLARVHAALAPESVLRLQPLFRQIVIDAPALEVRRDTAGRLHVAGLELRGEDGADNALADWFFSQEEFVIRGGSLRWVDELRAAPVLELGQMDLKMRNSGRRHDWRLDATPPPEWGARFSLRGRFTQPLLAAAARFEKWSGTAYAELPLADVQRLRKHIDLPFELNEGAGSLRLWTEVREGELLGATADLALQAVDVRLAQDLQPLVLEQLLGRVKLQRLEEGYRVAGQNLGFRTGDGREWAPGDWTVEWQQAPQGAVRGGELRFDRIDLAVLADLAARLPLGAAVRHDLAELQPRGQLQRLQLRWQGPPDAPTSYRTTGRVEGLQLAAQRLDAAALKAGEVGRPGWAGVDLEFEAHDQGGDAQLQLTDGRLEFPGVFADPVIDLQRLQARLQWTLRRAAGASVGEGMPEIELRVREVRFANADMEGTLGATWRTGAAAAPGGVTRPSGAASAAPASGASTVAAGRGGAPAPAAGPLPGVLDLRGRLSRADATRVWRYLPLGLGDATQAYIRDAVLAGRASEVEFSVRGELQQFPFQTREQGEFRITSLIQDASFAYVPPEPGAAPAWPAFTQVNGRLVFDGVSMQIRDARARLFGFELAQVNGGIANLLRNPVLALDGQGRGPLADALRFVNETPVGGWTQNALQQARGSGPAQLRLGVRIPLEDLDRARVNGVVTLQGNDVQVTPDSPPMAQARGTVEFSDSGFTVKGATARIFGGAASFEGGTGKDGMLRFQGQGTATAAGLRQARELSWLPYLAEHLEGQTPYRARLAVVEGHTELEINSELVGLRSRLPAPLDKPAATPLPLQLRTRLDEAPVAGRPVRDTVSLQLGRLLDVHYEREWQRDSWQVLRGGIGINEPAPRAQLRGVMAMVNQPSLDLDAWRAVAASFQGAGGGAPATAAGQASEADGYLPQLVSLRSNQLLVEGRTLTRLVAGLSREGSVWRANLEADQLSGYVEYRPPRGSGGEVGGKVFARLSRLNLPQSAADGVESLLEQEPAAVPALDIIVNDFQLNEVKFGRVEIEASNRRTAEIREWRLDRLLLANPDATLAATGGWQGVARGTQRRRADMNFQLDVHDSGALLQRLGLGEVVRGGKGRLEGRVNWLGSPLSLDYPTLGGQFNVDINKGQFLKADPGVAKLAGILSLQALPRRLTLDFRDVFQEGFAFDAFNGDVSIEQGVAYTNNLRLRGVSAVVLMEGRADIARETQDLRVVVVPEINAGTASLAYAAINPAVGLGTFLAQLLLSRGLSEVGTREFQVTGSWADPKIEPVTRKPGGSGRTRPEDGDPLAPQPGAS